MIIQRLDIFRSHTDLVWRHRVANSAGPLIIDLKYTPPNHRDEEFDLSVSSEKSLLRFPTICWLFFMLGCTCFGGMWAAMDRLQRELVERRGCLMLRTSGR